MHKTIYRDSDKIIDIALTSGGVAINLSTLSGIVVILYYPHTKVILSKYSLNPISGGYYPLSIVDNKIRVLLHRAITRDAALGTIFAEILEEVTTPGFENNEFRSIGVTEIGFIQRTIHPAINDL